MLTISCELLNCSFINGLRYSTDIQIYNIYKVFTYDKVELPRLLTGVPVEENQYQTFNGRNITSLAQELGIEKTYALSQALCSAKTEQATVAQ